jgi:hypothetical protein
MSKVPLYIGWQIEGLRDSVGGVVDLLITTGNIFLVCGDGILMFSRVTPFSPGTSNVTSPMNLFLGKSLASAPSEIATS